MAGLKIKITVPKVNLNWWDSSKNELTKLVVDHNKQSWGQQQDPVTMSPWAPRKAPTGSWPILRQTGKMQDTAKFRAVNTMIWSVRTTDYGPFHQYGTSKMPQRRWLGIGGTLLDPMAKVIGSHIFKGKTVIRIP